MISNGIKPETRAMFQGFSADWYRVQVASKCNKGLSYQKRWRVTFRGRVIKEELRSKAEAITFIKGR